MRSNRSALRLSALTLAATAIFSAAPTLLAADAPAPAPAPAVAPAPAPAPATSTAATAATAAQLAADTGAITEKDFDTYTKLDAKLKDIDTRAAAAKDDAGKAEAEKARAAAFQESGMSEARYTFVSSQVTQIKGLLNPADVKKDPQAAANSLAVLQLFDPTSVATVKAKTQSTSAKTNKLTGQALGGLGKVQAMTKPAPAPQSTLAAETPVDPAKLPGTWLFDLDATGEAVHPGLSPDLKQIVKDRMMAMLKASKYTFGPGTAATSYMLNSADGTESTAAATYTCDGKQITFTSTVDGHTTTLDCAMRGEFLMLGHGAQKAAFKPKTP